MYCEKCGVKILDGASFCQNCGASVGEAKTQQAGQQVGDFKAFVDNHVRKTTKFQSAEDLIETSKPWKFAWICVGVLSLIGLVLNEKNCDGKYGVIEVLFICGGFLGYVLVFLASVFIRRQYREKFSGKININIDYDDYVAFLNEHLKDVSTYFHECRYKDGYIACECGSKGQYLATISIRPDSANPKSGQEWYYVNAVLNEFFIGWCEGGFWGHGCLIRTAPIMQASIEYYASLKTK